MSALSTLVARIRAETGLPLPDADPHDAGTHARLLLLLERPGLGAGAFVSRDNATPTARNLRRFLHAAAIPRSRTLIWNVVPWADPNATRNVSPSARDIRAGLVWLRATLALLHDLQLVILAGRVARSARTLVCEATAVPVLSMPHPSPTLLCTGERFGRDIEACLAAASAMLNRQLLPSAAVPLACQSQERKMSGPDSLQSLYADEMKDLWSANDQMTRAVKTLAGKAHDPKLKELLESSIDGIGKHTASLKQLIERTDEEVEPEHCKGMEGLVNEALKHGVQEAPEDGTLRDIAIITQYQRMSHYGITGFGSVASVAEALGKADDVKTLKKIVSDIYKSDEYSSHLGELAAKAAAKHAA